MDWISETGIYEKFLPLYHMSNRPRSVNIFPSNEKKLEECKKRTYRERNTTKTEILFQLHWLLWNFSEKKMPNAVALLIKKT